MPRYLAVEWDDREARVAVARGRGDDITVEQAFAVDLSSGEGQTDADHAKVGRKLATALKQRGLSGLETLVAVGRSNIELRWLSLPPTPDEELPDMVRMQAQRQFTSLGDDWPVDFLPLDDDPNAARHVLAAAVTPDLIEQIKATCHQAELRPLRVVLRACATTSLLSTDSTKRRLIVNILSEEADFTVVSGGTVAFLRTARLPGTYGSEEQSAALLRELRRTIAAAHNQMGEQRVDEIVLLGMLEDLATLKTRVEEAAQLVTTIIDPFDGLSLGGKLKRERPDQPGRFAPLLGTLADQISEKRPAIDFLDPRKRPEPPSRKRTFVLAGIAAALLIGASLFLFWSMHQTRNKEIAKLNRELTAVKKEKERTDKYLDELDVIESWARNEVNWLDWLHNLSDRFPSADRAMLTKLTLSSNAIRRSGGGTVSFDGVFDGNETLADIEDELTQNNGSLSNKPDPPDNRLYSITATGSLTIPQQILGPEDIPADSSLEESESSD